MWEIIYFIVAVIISVALSPRPPDAKAAAFDDFDIPIAEEGKKVGVVFGKNVWVRGSNVLWYGNLWSKAIRKRSGFSKTTIGYKYYMGLLFGLCHGPVNALTKIEVGEKETWTGSITSNVGPSVIDRETMFGGEKQEGGILGYMRVKFGRGDQLADDYVRNKIYGGVATDQCPAHRGLFTFIYHGYIGTSKYLKPWAFLVSRTTEGWFNDEVWYEARAEIGDGMNPAHIVYECLTNRAWGRGLSQDRIDLPSFEAAADALYDEDFGLQFFWTQSIPIMDFVQTVMDHIAGALVYNPRTFKFELKLIRGDYEISELYTVNENNIVDVSSYQRQAWGETINELHVKYFHPDTGKECSLTAHDLANIQIQGGTNTETLEFKGVRRNELASRIAVRELSARSTPLAKIEFSMNRTGAFVHQGQVLNFNWSKLGIVDMAIRVLQIEKGSLTDGTIRVVAIQDIFSIEEATYIVVPPSEMPPTDPPGTEDEGDNSDATVISTSLTSPPGSPNDGDRYFVQPGTGTGAWLNLSGLVEWDAQFEYDHETETYTGAWVPVALAPGTIIYDQDQEDHVSTDEDGTTGSLVPGPLQKEGATWVRGSDAIATPTNVVYTYFAEARQIERVALLTGPAGTNGTCTVDIWVDDDYPPTVADTITASAKPQITSGQSHYEDATLTGWTTLIPAGSWVAFNLDANTAFRYVSVQLFVREP